jgi:hypothetical protein
MIATWVAMIATWVAMIVRWVAMQPQEAFALTQFFIGNEGFASFALTLES